MIKNLYLNKQKIYYKTIKFDKFIIIYFFKKYMYKIIK